MRATQYIDHFDHLHRLNRAVYNIWLVYEQALYWIFRFQLRPLESEAYIAECCSVFMSVIIF